MKKLTKIQETAFASVEQINEIESEFQFHLPYDYKWFLLTQNPKQVAEYKTGIADLQSFYTLNINDNASLSAGYESLRDFFGKTYLPFAYDPGGWQFVICIEKGENYGKVYFCRMDEDLDKALTLLADSFEEFINGLKIE